MIFDRLERFDRSRHRNRSNRRRKIIFAKRSKTNAAPAENCSGPENRDASISLCKHIANAKEFSIVFEHLDRSRHRNRSNRRRKIIFAKRSKINAAPAENCSGPENRDASISSCKPIANAIEISIVFEHLDRSTHRNRSNRRRKIADSKYGEINGAQERNNN